MRGPRPLGGGDDLADPLAALADNVLVLRRGGAPPRRTLAVAKMRFSAHVEGAHEFAIVAPHGIQLGRPFRRWLGRDGMSERRDAVRGDGRTAPPLVLIAEDEESIAEVVEMLVAEAGYGTVVARDGRQALALARERWPALLITDMMMPHLDGIDLIAALRAEAADSRRTTPPAILMTAASIPYARAAHADALLRKPFDLEELEGLLRRFLGDHAGGG